ncbi:MAG: M20/M25/M40 family metallo-hydrolase [Alphaproteobacteria bacterium]|nr:M20/M25/M40 family metallo-hydrolase [Alphaproteobacteria bacterium]
MIAADTSFPPGAGYAGFADLMEELCQPLGFACARVVVPDQLWAAPESAGDRVNLIARRRAGKPACSIYFHVDTVPAGDGWTMPPHGLTRIGANLHGRGTADMKGTIAATLLALRAAEAVGLPLAYDPTLLFCTDEEGGLYPGVRYLAERGLIEGHVLCLNGPAAPRIWAGCFGSLDLAIRIEGRAAHSGDPIGGINAVDQAIPILTALLDLKSRIETRRSAMPPPPHRQNEGLAARLNVTAIRAGAKGSALPGLCTLVINRRYLPEESADAVRAELEQAIRSAAASTQALSVAIDVVGHLAPVRDPDRGPHWPRWRQALAYGFGYRDDQFRRWGASSSSDMGFVQACGIHEILLGGLSRPEARIHAADEFTTIGDVQSLAKAILVYLAQVEIPAPAAAAKTREVAS